ncbi:hypothetical protein [Pseudofrankia sp. BMG5.37]|uniref:hypothetical protein n=1 Tax=Pseudofrankia sp. BMG5.37 TaxID=3050035 RepID=UPI0008DAA636|nr:hypothetical protein [Pseudofrankia sp. BMG5.37]MDT3439075.1 hypothetical protein [Pseudofrankia sp. BMG5.37]OHV45823.1 hypothetical protein BCD48_21720 [Pseudofrankia sp. BMG5.36]
MHVVSGNTSSARRKPRLVAEAPSVPSQPRRLHQPPAAATPGRPSWVAVRLHAALSSADRPLRARSLAYDLGLSAAEVTVELRRMQDLGVAASRDRRWTIVGAAPTTADAPAAAPSRKSA